MAGIPGKGGVKGKSGPPGNMNAFKHGLVAIQKRREPSTEHEESVRQQILKGLIADKGGISRSRQPPGFGRDYSPSMPPSVARFRATRQASWNHETGGEGCQT